MAESLLAIGLGNELRGDDAAGLWVADLLRGSELDAVRCEGEPIEVLDLFQGRPRVLLIDAVAGEHPGRIWRLNAHAGELPLIFAERSSTHLIGLAEVTELGRSLGLLPAELEVIGIEGDSFALGRRPSIAVEEAIGDVAAAIGASAGRVGGDLSPRPAGLGQAS